MRKAVTIPGPHPLWRIAAAINVLDPSKIPALEEEHLHLAVPDLPPPRPAFVAHPDDEALFDPNQYGVRRILISLGATVKEIQAEVIPPEHVRPCAAYVLTNALNGQVRRVPLSARGRSRVPLRALECIDA